MKVKCVDCINQERGKCSIKRTSVKLNKSRKCDSYKLDIKKDIARLERLARVLDHQEAPTKEVVAHPVTGDLSRFKTSASE